MRKREASGLGASEGKVRFWWGNRGGATGRG